MYFLLKPLVIILTECILKNCLKLREIFVKITPSPCALAFKKLALMGDLIFKSSAELITDKKSFAIVNNRKYKVKRES
ncbi:hypothetical protein C6H64_21720 [Photorhabdus luminescens]|nr:hypothetical protein C6H64_21720 [Photorhabdus luminescens]